MADETYGPFELLTVREAAEALRCSESTIRRALKEKRIRWFRVREPYGAIRIPYSGLAGLIEPHLYAAADEATAATSERVS